MDIVKEEITIRKQYIIEELERITACLRDEELEETNTHFDCLDSLKIAEKWIKELAVITK